MDEPTFAPICIWCNAPWSDSNVKLETIASGYCETCYSEDHKIVITCHSCKKVMYQKDVW